MERANTYTLPLTYSIRDLWHGEMSEEVKDRFSAYCAHLKGGEDEEGQSKPSGS